ncbi:MAG: electron transport complex subunit E [Candidatus Tenebribacter davisii]|nr:electron transport complex subunit E [Candidatus Tenebribacter davisii]
MAWLKEFTKGFIKENPVFVMALGLCPTLAVSSSVINAIGMGLAATFVLVFSNMFISLIKNLIPSKIRIPAYIVVIASFVTIVDMVMHAYLPAIHKSLGLFIPLIVVNCIILGRAEAFASKNNVFLSILDGLGMGLGFTLALVVIGSIREILGAGQFLGMNVLPATYKPMLVAILAPGAFIVMGLLMSLMNLTKKK